MQTEIKANPELQLLAQQIEQGWPEKIGEVDEQIQQYWSFQEDITISDGLLVKGHRIIVPKAMRYYMLSQVHEGHFGMDKCKARMSNCYYWPGINCQIERMIWSCSTCLEFAESKPKTPKKDMLHHKVPETPWCKLATDFHGTNYLILMDYISRFPIVKQLKGMDESPIINISEDICSKCGYPDVVVSDNGPCYKGE